MTVKQVLSEPWTGARLIALATGLLALGGSVGSVIALIAGRIGLAIIGPPDAMAAFEVRHIVDSAYTQSRIAENGAHLRELTIRVQRMERIIEIWTYVQCTEMKRRDPVAVPRSCNEVIGQ